MVVLVVEDSTTMRQLICLALKKIQGIVLVVDHAEGERVGAPVVALEQDAKGLVVTGPRAPDQLRVLGVLGVGSRSRPFLARSRSILMDRRFFGALIHPSEI